jgi:hypothetical protein
MVVIEEGLRLAGFAGWKQLAEACNSHSADVNLICTVILLQTLNMVSLSIR